MTDTDHTRITSALATMVAEAPDPLVYDELAAVTAKEAPPLERRWSPVAVAAAGFAITVLIVGVIAFRGLPFTDSDAGAGNTTIYVVPTDVPDDLVLRGGEVWNDGKATTQIYVEATATHHSEKNRAVTVNANDVGAAAASTDDPEFYDTAEVFSSLLANAEDIYGPDISYRQTTVRDRPAMVFERTETGTDGTLGLYVDIVVSEGQGVFSETSGQNLTVDEALDVAKSLQPVPADSFPDLAWPGADPS